MCRSIKVLRGPELIATREEMEAAALQYVRKVSGCRKPSRARQEAFDRAVQEVAAATERLLAYFSAPSQQLSPPTESGHSPTASPHSPIRA